MNTHFIVSLILFNFYYVCFVHTHLILYNESSIANKNLIDCILSENYDKNARPSNNPFIVNVSIYITDISRNSELMDLTVNLILRQEWEDPRLKFNNCTKMPFFNLPKNYMRHIWRPDTILNFNDPIKAMYMQVKPNGKVLYSSIAVAKTHCTMDFTFFPVDQQNCSFWFESDADFSINYRWNALGNAEHSSFHNETVYLPALRFLGYNLRCTHNRYFPQLHVDLLVSRSVIFYLARFYLPACFVVIISFLPLYLTPNSHSKVTLGVMIQLTMTTLMTSTNSELPKISYLTSLDVYMFVCYFAVFLAVLQYAVIGYYDCRVVSLKTKNTAAKICLNSRRKDVESLKRAKDKRKKEARKEAQRRAKVIDYTARWLFLIAFALFNVVYVALLSYVAIKNSQVEIQVKHNDY